MRSVLECILFVFFLMMITWLIMSLSAPEYMPRYGEGCPHDVPYEMWD